LKKKKKQKKLQKKKNQKQRVKNEVNGYKENKKNGMGRKSQFKRWD
jgi:hypothetical protein